MRSLRVAPALLAVLLLLPGCDRTKEPTPEEIAAKLASDLEEAAARLRNNKVEDAERIYTKILETHADHADATGGLGKVRLEQKRYADAEALLTKAVASKAEDAVLQAALGHALQAQDKHAQAADAYGKAFGLDDDNSDYGLAYGRELTKAGKLTEAEKVLRDVAELDPKAQFVFTQLGDVLLEQKRVDEALATYMKAQNAYRSDKMAHAGAALAYEAKGDNKHALDEWSSYIRMDCCSEYSKSVAQKKVQSLEVEHAEAPPTEGEGEGDEVEQAG